MDETFTGAGTDKASGDVQTNVQFRLASFCAAAAELVAACGPNRNTTLRMLPVEASPGAGEVLGTTSALGRSLNRRVETIDHIPL